MKYRITARPDLNAFEFIVSGKLEDGSVIYWRHYISLEEFKRNSVFRYGGSLLGYSLKARDIFRVFRETRKAGVKALKYEQEKFKLSGLAAV